MSSRSKSSSAARAATASDSEEEEGDDRVLVVSKAQYERDLKEELDTSLPSLKNDALGEFQWMSIPRPDALDHHVDADGNIIYFSRWLMLFCKCV